MIHLLARLPAPLKSRLRQWQRLWKDRRSGDFGRFANPGVFRGRPECSGPFSLAVEQPFLPSSTLAAKRRNIQLAAERMDGCVLAPGQIFSFWHLAGPPTAARGFREGRNIVGGRLGLEIGGGLCQLSALLHCAALRAGLEILERHPHSLDLYHDREHERYTPPGTDATVVFGHKDLRFRNPLPHPVGLRLSVEPARLVCTFSAPVPLPDCELRCHLDDLGDRLEARVERFLAGQSLGTLRSVYRKMPAAGEV